MTRRAPAIAAPLLAVALAAIARPPEAGLTFAPGDSLNGVSPIVLDARFDDWTDVPLSAVDPPDDAAGAFDISHVWATSRGTTVYVRFNTGRTLNLQAGYEDEGTLVWTFTAPDGGSVSIDVRARAVFLDADPERTVSHAEFAYIAAPTCASEEFEFQVDLAPLGVGVGDSVTIGVEGSDSVTAFPCPLIEPRAAVARLPLPLAPDAGVVRVANFNVLHGGLTDPTRRERMARLLRAADADIYMFQEQWRTGATAIAQAMNEMVPLATGSWNVVASGDGTAIASRYPLTMSVPDVELRSATVGVVDVAGAPLVVVSLHLKCCGFAGSEEDLRRIATMRDLRAFIDARFGVGPLAPSVIVAGDWNLVGSPTPLRASGPPPRELTPHWPHPGATHAEHRREEWWARQHERGVRLTPLELRHVDATSMHTWRDAASPFPPGRLDYIAVDAPRWTLMGSWVIDAAGLRPDELDAMGLRAQDSSVSDHLLLIADFASGPDLLEHEH